MILLLSLFSLTMACGGEVNTDDTNNEDTGIQDTADTGPGLACDYSAIEGDWAGQTPQGNDQELNLTSAAEVGDLVGSNYLYIPGQEEPACTFQMSCEIPIEGLKYQLYNTVEPGSSTTCAPGWYAVELVGDELEITVSSEQDSSGLLIYTLQAK